MKQGALVSACALACALVVAGCGPSQPTASGAQQATGSGTPAPQAIGGGAQSPHAKPLVRLLAPNAPFATAGGQAVTLQQFAGQVVVLNLWAPWCNPCVREMPSLDALAVRAPETAVITVSMDVHGPQVASEFLKRKGLDHLGAYYDPDAQLMRALGVFGLPVSVVIDREGRIAATIQGAVDWNSADMRALLARV